MSCVEKRHMRDRVGSMLHHRFPNGFTDLFMDETDREVSTLTDRAFRSLCVGDDAIYNDDFLYGYSPFSCHKPLVHHRDSKKHGQCKNKSDSQPWKKQQKKNISQMSSFLKAMSTTGGNCEGMLIQNGDMHDSNGESWDKSALRSIQKELSEFSSSYHTTPTDRHYKNQNRYQSSDGSSNKMSKDAGLPSGKSTKMKNNKTNVKLRKLNIKNFFLHSEFSPFQSWTNFNQFPFSQKETITSVLPGDNIPKWYDLSFYKELTETHRKDILEKDELQPCHKQAVEPCPTPPCFFSLPKPGPSPPPPNVLSKPSGSKAEERCTSEGGDVSAAPWRRNKSRATSTVPGNLPGMPLLDNIAKTIDESLLLIKKQAKSVEVQAVEEVSYLASTPFSICQLMTPLIPSRQPTETSEILQDVFSPLALDLPAGPQSEAKVTPEPPVKRDNYKALASSILFNLKDNRKRVKSRYSPHKFKNLECLESSAPSPQSDHVNATHAGSQGNVSGLSTPTILKEVPPVFGPVVEPVSSTNVDLSKPDADKPLSDDYLLSSLLHTKKDATGNSGFVKESPSSPFVPLKKNKSPLAKKQNYPSLNLYKKANPVDTDAIYCQIPVSISSPAQKELSTKTYDLSPLTLSKYSSPKTEQTRAGMSPNTLNVTDCSFVQSPSVLKTAGKSLTEKTPENTPDKIQWSIKDAKEKDFGAQVLPKDKDISQTISTVGVIRAAREAINAAKSKARSQIINKPKSDEKELEHKLRDGNVSADMFNSKSMPEGSAPETSYLSHQSELSQSGQKSNVIKDPPPVPKRNLTKADIQLALDKQQMKIERVSNGDLGDAKLELLQNENKSVKKPSKYKHFFSARQNNYIKHQRYAVADDDGEGKKGNLIVNTGIEMGDDVMSLKEVRDSEHIINYLLEKARLGDCVPENMNDKLATVNIEEAKAKNNLISKELRNIKRGMMSMKGNTISKRDILNKKEQEQSKHKDFLRIDSNVIVNKAVINGNYDKAKMALEEIISEREKKKNHFAEHDDTFDDSEESSLTGTQQFKEAIMDSMTDTREKQNDLKDRLVDLRDHIQMRNILSQTEPQVSETHRTGGQIALPGMDKRGAELDAFLKAKNKSVAGHPNYVTTTLMSDEINESDLKKMEAPPVPPRSKRGSHGSHDIIMTESDAGDEEAANKYGDCEVNLNNTWTDSGRQQFKETISGQNEMASYEENRNIVKQPKSGEASLNSSCTPSENMPCLSPGIHINENTVNTFQICSPTSEASSDNSCTKIHNTCKIKRIVPLKPDHPTLTENSFQTSLADEQNNIINTVEEVILEVEAPNNAPRLISPLLLVNGLSVKQSPPDQASMSSKSSYFSVESALQRNVETESNVFHSLENLTGQLEQVNEAVQNVPQQTKQCLERADLEYYSLSDHENEPEVVQCPIMLPEKEPGVPQIDSRNKHNKSCVQNENNSMITSLSNTFSPSLTVPALFKVKDNIFTNKVKKTLQPLSPRRCSSGTKKVEEVSHEIVENPECQLVNENTSHIGTLILPEIFIPEEITPNPSKPFPLLSPSNLQENTKDPDLGSLLAVPMEEDRCSGVSLLSEGVESLTNSAADTAEEMVVTKILSKHLGSTCSTNDTQTGLLKPPAVLPKSEKAVLKAVKLTNKRMKKEEAHKASQNSSRSKSKQRASKHKCVKSEHENSSSSCKDCGIGESKNREKTERNQHPSNSPRNEELPGKEENHHCNQTEMIHKARGQSYDSLRINSQPGEGILSGASEREGQPCDPRVREKPEPKRYSNDQIISNVPVYKAQIGVQPLSRKPFHRTQSVERYTRDKEQRRFSAEMSVNEKIDPRSQQIEKSILDDFHQRGRARDKTARKNPPRRSHSIDTCSTEAPHASPLSRQSSYTCQLSRQSSIEHTIMQSFPLTQRKLLQDPDSGQYFFVDMPMQLKTKTFFDPETGNYVQLPVQPSEAAVPQASPMEVLSPPMVLYRGFVPVPLSPMAQKAPVQAPSMEAKEFQQRQQERSRQMYYKDGQPYLEPVYAQHDLMLGEFIGTEELDWPR